MKVKNPEIEAGGKKYLRIPVKTHVIFKGDNITDVIKKYALPELKKNDIIFISEKAVAIAQGRAFPVKDIRPRPLAVFLSRHVTKTPSGIGLGIPETMEMALKECGIVRILIAAAAGFAGKLLGRKGDFYRVAGYKASSIDGPTPNTLPPYNTYVVLGPDNPDSVARKIAGEVRERTVIVDLNDLGGKILGRSERSIDKKWLLTVLRDNPLGQSSEQTPVGIIRELQS
jgi:F420-0:gamma-glutamyl ligase